MFCYSGNSVLMMQFQGVVSARPVIWRTLVPILCRAFAKQLPISITIKLHTSIHSDPSTCRRMKLITVDKVFFILVWYKILLPHILIFFFWRTRHMYVYHLVIVQMNLIRFLLWFWALSQQENCVRPKVKLPRGGLKQLTKQFTIVECMYK